jgi:hypothetical protein
MRCLPRRWWFWMGMGFLFAVLADGYFLIAVAGSKITQANCDKIQLDWTLTEVVGFIGAECIMCQSDVVWTDDDGNRIVVTFANRHAVKKLFEPSNLSFAERVNRRLKRLWLRVQALRT